MAIGTYAFRDVRAVVEATPGLKVDTATQRMLGKLTFPMGGPIIHRPEDENASLAYSTRSYVVGEELEFTFEGDCIPEQLQNWLNMAIVGNDSPVGAYVWEFKHTLASASTPKPHTFQFGDDLAQFDVEYCLCRSLEIAGAINGPMTIAATLFGRNFETTSWDPAAGSLADLTTVNVFKSNKNKLAIDAAGGTIGLTEKAATLLDLTWRLETGYSPQVHGSGSGSLFFDTIVQAKPRLTVDMTIQFNTIAEAERAIYEANTRRLFRIYNLESGNTGLRLDFSGIYTNFGPPIDNEGGETCAVTVEAELDTAFTDLFAVVLDNTVAALI